MTDLGNCSGLTSASLVRTFSKRILARSENFFTPTGAVVHLHQVVQGQGHHHVVEDVILVPVQIPVKVDRRHQEDDVENAVLQAAVEVVHRSHTVLYVCSEQIVGLEILCKSRFRSRQ